MDRGAVAAAPARGRPRTRQARHRHGRLGTRDVRSPTGSPTPSRASPQLRAGRRDDAPRDRRPARRRASSTTSCGASPLGSSELRERHPHVLAHAANSAATLRDPASHFDMVRCGLAIYGLDPFGEDAARARARAGARADSYVAAVKPCRAGRERGLRAALRRARRTRSSRCCRSATATAGGAACPTTRTCSSADGAIRLWGPSSMDNITVDLGPARRRRRPSQSATRAVLIGADGDQRVSAEEVAAAWRRSTTRSRAA